MALLFHDPLCPSAQSVGREDATSTWVTPTEPLPGGCLCSEIGKIRATERARWASAHWSADFHRGASQGREEAAQAVLKASQLAGLPEDVQEFLTSAAAGNPEAATQLSPTRADLPPATPPTHAPAPPPADEQRIRTQIANQIADYAYDHHPDHDKRQGCARCNITAAYLWMAHMTRTGQTGKLTHTPDAS